MLGKSFLAETCQTQDAPVVLLKCSFQDPIQLTSISPDHRLILLVLCKATFNGALGLGVGKGTKWGPWL